MKMFNRKEKGGSSVKLGSALKGESFSSKIKKYINHKGYIFKLWSARINNDYLLREKIIQLFSWTVNIIVTGILINYILENKDFLSYGLAVILSLFYLDVIVQIIKKPYNDKK